MQSKFSGYYRKTEDQLEQLIEKCLFVFDTNVLLHLYALSAASRDEFLGVLEQVQQRIWIPHQVGLEFHKNRLKAIDDARKAPISHQAELKKLKASFLIYLKTHDRYAATEEPEQLREVVEEAFEGLLGIAERVSLEVRGAFGEDGTYEVDPVLDRVTELFDDSRVGDQFSTEDRLTHEKEAQRRLIESPPLRGSQEASARQVWRLFRMVADSCKSSVHATDANHLRNRGTEARLVVEALRGNYRAATRVGGRDAGRCECRIPHVSIQSISAICGAVARQSGKRKHNRRTGQSGIYYFQAPRRVLSDSKSMERMAGPG